MADFQDTVHPNAAGQDRPQDHKGAAAGPEIQDYINKHSLRLPDVFERLRDATATKLGSKSVMQAPRDEAQFLSLLLKTTGAKKILEVGTFTGFSTLAFALAIPDDGRVVTFDITDEYPTVGKPFWEEQGVAKKIELRVGPASEKLEELLAQEGEAGTWDFAFIDADKLGYAQYYELSLKLLRKGGLIAIDNVLWGGAVTKPADQHDESTQAIDKLNKFIFTDDRVEISMLGIGDGVTLALKK